MRRLLTSLLTLICLTSSSTAQNSDYADWLKKEQANKRSFNDREKGLTTTRNEAEPDKPNPATTPIASDKAEPAAIADDFSESPFCQYIKRSDLILHKTGDALSSNFAGVINDGHDALVLRLHLIRNARRTIDIQTFIFMNDECGRLIMYELIKAAQRGVKIRIIADHFASEQDRDLVAFLAEVNPNLEIKHYRPVADRLEPSKLRAAIHSVLPNKTNQRMHNKVFLVDDLMAITGGRNIENNYYSFSTGMNFKDRDAFLIGPVALDVKTSFNEFWEYKHSVRSTDLDDVKKTIKKGTFKKYLTKADFAFGDLFEETYRMADNNKYMDLKFAKRLVQPRQVVFLVDKPGKNNSFFWMSGKGRITKQLAELISTAERKLIIQTPYLVLDSETRNLFSHMKRNNKKLEIIVSSNSYAGTDNIVAYSANFRLRSSYIEDCGLEIYEYKPHPDNLLKIMPSYPEMEKRAVTEGAERKPFLCIHAKSFVIDDQHTFIGSYNLDPRSANLNTEVGILIDDPVIAALVTEDITTDCQPENSWVVNKREMPLNLDAVNGLIEGTMRLTPIDIWPIRNSTCYELIPGKIPVRPYDPDFYNNYRDAGSFPGASKGMTEKEMVTRIYKTVGGAFQHLF